MQPDFWHNRWATSQIAFHESAVNPLLAAHYGALALQPGARVFVPLCGKTLDIDWLLSHGNRVAGAELSALAVAQLFERLGAVPVVERVGDLQRHSIDGLDIFVGDIFRLDGQMLGAVDAVFDRAALIALPPQMRERYVLHLRALTGNAPQLLVTLEYDQQLVEGPPFSVSADEVRHRYAGRVPVQLSHQHLPQGLKGKYPVTEIAWQIP
jgi:thiopurine S-methyltransferase